MKMSELNNLDEARCADALRNCCGAGRWIEGMLSARPFHSIEDLRDKANSAWAICSAADWLEAFRHHPKIGDLKTLEKKFGSTAEWAGGEQSGVRGVDPNILVQLAEANEAYEKKFGFIFIICATGKSAAEMLNSLKRRMENSYEAEIRTAANEQHKITLLRLNKLLS